MPLRAAAFYALKEIELRLGEHVAGIDRAERTVDLASGERLRYGHLVLATGARARPFAVPGADLDGVLKLRDLDDARALSLRVAQAQDVLVVGAGFIGLELTAVIAGMGKRARVVEMGPRPLGRAVSSQISTFFHDSHVAVGAELLLGAGITALEGTNGVVSGAVLSDGRRIATDLVLVGIGVLASDGLAQAAGLACDDGVLRR